ncbi:hypothetical protein KDH_20950 [Dictyobacter sp. S3.2.2.5]|uniref:DUF3592 domain-containing protein n=1 Tax=Dictyobacter halimunensis TaxID=3026934 RepID=A0ABQ6FR19_9CHLR|nr:hypothetical protein KDH_20950 [Dictyobacter sp. S3.2.2.5]
MGQWLVLSVFVLLGIIGIIELVFGIYCAVMAVSQFIRARRERRRLVDVSWQERQHASLLRKGGSTAFFFSMGAVWLLASTFFLGAFLGSIAYANAFQPGRCTIVSTRLVREKITKVVGSHEEYNSSTDRWETVDDTWDVLGYRPYYTVRLNTDQDSVDVNGPDVYQDAQEDASSAQAILKQYQRGTVYSCWYFPPDKQQITFNEPPRSNLSLAFILIPVTVTGLIGTVFTILAFRRRRKARQG